MNLFEQLQKQRYEALKVFGNEMWGVVVHAQTYRELVAECLDGRAVFRIGDVCATPNGDYIFGLRIIPSFGVAPNTFTIVDKRLGENILGTEAWYKADRKTEPTGYNLSPVDKDINVRSKDEPQTDGILFKGNLKEGDYKLIKTSNGWVLEGNDIAYYGEPKTDCPWK